MARQPLRYALTACISLFALQPIGECFAGTVVSATKQPFTVRDSIAWTHVLPFSQKRSRDRVVALFSPDGSHFVLHTRSGDLARNVNVHSLLLYATRDVDDYGRSSTQSREAPKPVTLASIDAARDEDSLSGVQWLSNSQLGFVARVPGGRMQAFAVDIATRSLTQMTASDTDVMGFARTGQIQAYYACVPYVKEKPLVVLVDSFEKTVPSIENNSESTCYLTTPVNLFVGPIGQAASRLAVPAMQLYPHLKRIWLAPAGDYAIIVAPAVNAPVYWSEYTGPGRDRLGFAADSAHDDPASVDVLDRTRYLLADLRTGVIRPLLDAPNGQMSLNFTPLEVFWRKDGRSVVVSSTYLSLDGVDEGTRVRRSRQPAIAEVHIGSGEVTPIAWEATAPDAQRRVPNPIVGFDWNADADRLTVIHERTADGVISREAYSKRGKVWKQVYWPSTSDVRAVKIEEHQSLNERPKIYVSDTKSGKGKVLFDPNPQAEQLSFGRTEILQWKDANGIDWTGGLLLPPTYIVGTRYPLVVQTHGFKTENFLLDGPNDGRGAGTAFSAQALANAGFVVLQIEDNRRTITNDHLEGPAVAEGFRSGIERLIANGLVDASKVGLIAFSRTGYQALHLVAQYPNMLAALTMSDTLFVGYSIYSYNVTRPATAENLAKLTNGKPNFASMGEWFANNPVYALGRSRAAMRLEGMVQGLGMWELYAILREANRPVEYVMYPDGSHVLQKPEERLSSQGGNVDWFRFWLQAYEDPDPTKAEQYARWRRLREQQQRRAEQTSR